jgi:hypothetical protein
MDDNAPITINNTVIEIVRILVVRLKTNGTNFSLKKVLTMSLRIGLTSEALAQQKISLLFSFTLT